MMRILRRLADSNDPNSFATRLRQKRFALFSSLLAGLPRPLRILDVGGEQIFWERMGIADDRQIQFMIFNLYEEELSYPNFESMAGDARNLEEFGDGEFDVVFSNSVIEHVGNLGQQAQMAREVRRVGKRYFLQTPNRYFPIEPHFLFPFFQFLPLKGKIFVLTHFNVTYTKRKWTPEEAREIAQGIRLLTLKELRSMFPGAVIRRERLLGLTKSFMVFDGWTGSHTRP